MAVIDHLKAALAKFEEALLASEAADEELNLTPWSVPWVTPSYHIQLSIHQLRIIIRCMEESLPPPP